MPEETVEKQKTPAKVEASNKKSIKKTPLKEKSEVKESKKTEEVVEDEAKKVATPLKKDATPVKKDPTPMKKDVTPAKATPQKTEEIKNIDSVDKYVNKSDEVEVKENL